MGNEKEIAIIPKGNYVSIMSCRIALAEDTKVEANQADLDYILKEQENFDKGIGVIGGAIKNSEYITIHSPTGSVTIKRSEITD